MVAVTAQDAPPQSWAYCSVGGPRDARTDLLVSGQHWSNIGHTLVKRFKFNSQAPYLRHLDPRLLCGEGGQGPLSLQGGGRGGGATQVRQLAHLEGKRLEMFCPKTKSRRRLQHLNIGCLLNIFAGN